MRRRTHGAHRVMAAVLGILVMLLGPLAVENHLAAQAHGRCEHGDEVHVERVAAPDAPVQPTTGAPTVAAPTWWQTHGDHHCSSTVTAVATTADRVDVALAIAATRPVPLRPIARAAVATALYRLAPKTSPPV